MIWLLNKVYYANSFYKQYKLVSPIKALCHKTSIWPLAKLITIDKYTSIYNL